VGVGVGVIDGDGSTSVGEGSGCGLLVAVGSGVGVAEGDATATGAPGVEELDGAGVNRTATLRTVARGPEAPPAARACCSGPTRRGRTVAPSDAAVAAGDEETPMMCGRASDAAGVRRRATRAYETSDDPPTSTRSPMITTLIGPFRRLNTTILRVFRPIGFGADYQ
jgi:hypothetical protein